MALVGCGPQRGPDGTSGSTPPAPASNDDAATAPAPPTAALSPDDRAPPPDRPAPVDGAVPPAAAPPTAGDGLYAYQGFTEPVGTDLYKMAGGVGFRAAWDVHYGEKNNLIAADPPMTYLDLETTGNFVHHRDNFEGRLLDVAGAFAPVAVGKGNDALVGAPGASIWFSVLLRRPAGSTATGPIFCELYPARNGIAYDADGVWAVAAFPATGSGRWSLFAGSTPYCSMQEHCPVARSARDMVPGTTYLIVVRLDFRDVGGDASLFVNPPALGGAPPAMPDARLSVAGSLAFRAVNCGAQDQSDFDEIRIGSSFAAVTPR